MFYYYLLLKYPQIEILQVSTKPNEDLIAGLLWCRILDKMIISWTFYDQVFMDTIRKIAFGGGCHWCTEAVLLSLKGVNAVEQGFIAAKEPASSFSEAVIVSYDEDQISLKELIAVHLNTHNSTADHSLRTKYRSAVYVFEVREITEVKEILTSLQNDFVDPLITQILQYVDFKPSEVQFHNYYYSNPEKPFCETYIVPKLNKISQDFSNLLDLKKVNRYPLSSQK
ncbi:MAG: peptide-methionine (S)-S-oxide reductase [Sediminicola sp.]